MDRVDPLVPPAQRDDAAPLLTRSVGPVGVARSLVIALSLAAVGVSLKALLMQTAGIDPFYLVYFPTIALSAWAAGSWPGLLTAVVSGAVDATLFQTPRGELVIADGQAQVRLGLFLVAASIISGLTGLLRTARAAAEVTREETAQTARREGSARHAAERAAERLDLMRSVAMELSSAVTPEDVASAVLRGASDTLGMDAGAVAIATADGQGLATIAMSGYGEDVGRTIAYLPLDGTLPASVAARTRTPLWFENEDSLRERFPGIPRFPNYRYHGSLAVLPLTARDRLVGVMWLRFARPRSLDPDDRSFMTALAQQCAQALERARLFEAERQARTDAERSERQLALLADASALLGASPGSDANVASVARAVADAIGVWCSVDLLDEDGSLRQVAAAHPDRSRERQFQRFRERFPVDPRGSGPIGTVLATGRPIVVNDVPAAPPDAVASDPAREALLHDLDGRSYVAVPLAAGAGPFGVLSLVASGADRPFDERDLGFAQDLARRIASSIENARLYRELDQFKGTVDASLDAVFIFDPRTLRYSYVNEGAVAQLGYGRDELLTMRALDIEPNLDEDGYRELIASLTGSGERSHTFTTVHRRRDGSEVPVEVFLQAVPLPGGGASMVANARDISERIEGQARLYRLARSERTRAAELNAVLQAMGEAILVCDSEGTVFLANRAAEALFGDVPRDRDDLASRLQGDQTIPPLGRDAGPIECRLIGARERWIELTMYPVALDSQSGERRAAAPASVATILVMRDVTEVREAQVLREAFLGVLSHELRTPITTIYGTTKVLARPASSLDPELRAELLSDIGAEADRLHRIVEDLVVLSRAETGIEIEGEPLLLRHLIPSVVASERQRWPSTEFTIDIAERLPTVRGDATYVEQVLRNLLGNAAKYSIPPGTVTISAQEIEDEVVVRVCDRGVGIQPDEIGRLFELFYRSPETTARARGAGIGLWVCRRLVEGMGGRIWAKPRPGGGSEFGFSLRPFLETDVG